MLEIVRHINLHHARLLYIVTELFFKGVITEDQKLALKFGVFNDDARLMDFYYENIQDANTGLS